MNGFRTSMLCVPVLVACVLGVPAKAAATEPIFGLNDTPETFVERAGAAKSAGAEMARVPVSWERTEPAPGNFDFSWLDPAVTALRQRGIRPLFVLSAAPRWASPGCTQTLDQTCPVGEGFEDAYARLALELLRRYQGSQVQAWNEPNLAAFGSISPQRVAELTNFLYRVAPRKVIGPAASPGDAQYLSYTASAYRQINRHVPLAINLYPRSRYGARRPDRDWRRVRSIASGRQIWVTEIGFSTYEFGPRGQARKSIAAYRYLARHGARAIIFHCLQDPSPSYDWISRLGLLSAEGQPKPAYRALRRAVASFR